MSVETQSTNEAQTTTTLPHATATALYETLAEIEGRDTPSIRSVRSELGSILYATDAGTGIIVEDVVPEDVNETQAVLAIQRYVGNNDLPATGAATKASSSRSLVEALHSLALVC